MELLYSHTQKTSKKFDEVMSA